MAASKIQAVVKRFLLRRRAEKGAVAAIAIQTAWRSYAARQLLKRMKLAHHLSCRNHAAIIIQVIIIVIIIVVTIVVVVGIIIDVVGFKSL